MVPAEAPAGARQGARPGIQTGPWFGLRRARCHLGLVSHWEPNGLARGRVRAQGEAHGAGLFQAPYSRPKVREHAAYSWLLWLIPGSP